MESTCFFGGKLTPVKVTAFTKQFKKNSGRCPMTVPDESVGQSDPG